MRRLTIVRTSPERNRRRRVTRRARREYWNSGGEEVVLASEILNVEATAEAPENRLMSRRL